MKRLFEVGKGKNDREGRSLITDNEGLKFEGGKGEVEIDGDGVMDVLDKISDHYDINKEDAGAFIREVTESSIGESNEPSIDDYNSETIDDSNSETIDDLIVRHFTKELEGTDKSVYDLFNYKKTDCVIKDYKTGEVLVDLKDVEFPEAWSKNAMDIVASKYFRKAGVPETEHEVSMKQVAHRLSLFWTESLKDEGIITSKEKEKIFYDECAYMLLAQIASPNSPQFFNTGLKLAYNIDGGSGEGMYYYDKDKEEVVESKDKYTRSQTAACYIEDISDSLLGHNSITERFKTETVLFKGGSGIGGNFSALRSKGEKLSSGGSSSGLMSFLEPLDKSAGAIKSAGATRRSAKLVVVDVDHPEIMDFIQWKEKEENKGRALRTMGYDPSFGGEIYNTISGQNSNNSVAFTDDFMNKVINLDKDPDATIWLRGRVDSSVDREIKVREIWDAYCRCCWSTADPASFNRDIINTWHTTPAGLDGNYGAKYNMINAGNPCMEVLQSNSSSCNLVAINGYRFLHDNKFDVEGYTHAINMSILILEASINWGQSPTRDVAFNTYMFRQLGLGVGNIASIFMHLGRPYDSDEARAIASGLFSLMTGRAYYISSLMAKKVGAFKAFEINKPYMMRVIKNHAIASRVIDEPLDDIHYDLQYLNIDLVTKMLGQDFMDNIKENWSNALLYGNKYGYLNSQVVVAQPMGTVSYLLDASATSIEPFFGNLVYKKVVDGSMIQLVNPIIDIALGNLGYSKNEVDDIVNYMKANYGNIEDAPHIKAEHIDIFSTANKNGNGKRFISPMGHVRMVASIAPFLSGNASKTVNLPKEATIEEVEEVFIEAWKKGIKGITVYRESSKMTQPLNTMLDVKSDNIVLEDLLYKDLLEYAKKKTEEANAPKLQRKRINGIRNGRTHYGKIEDVKIYVTVNRDSEDNISEVYITSDKVGSTITGLLNSLSKTISTMLQYQIAPKDISRMYRGASYTPSGFVMGHDYIKNCSSISDFVSKVIDIELGNFKYCQIKPEGWEDKKPKITLSNSAKPKEISYNNNDNDDDKGEIVSGMICSECGSDKMRKAGVCYSCDSCGSTTGCS